MAEANLLSRREAPMRVNRAEAVLTGIDEGSFELERTRTFQHEAYLADSRSANRPALLCTARLASHAAEAAAISATPYIFNLRLRVRREIPSRSAAFWGWPL